MTVKRRTPRFPVLRSSARRSLGSRRQPCGRRCPTRPGGSYGCGEPDRARRSPRRFASTDERFTSQATGLQICWLGCEITQIAAAQAGTCRSISSKSKRAVGKCSEPWQLHGIMRPLIITSGYRSGGRQTWRPAKAPRGIACTATARPLPTCMSMAPRPPSSLISVGRELSRGASAITPDSQRPPRIPRTRRWWAETSPSPDFLARLLSFQE